MSFRQFRHLIFGGSYQYFLQSIESFSLIEPSFILIPNKPYILRSKYFNGISSISFSIRVSDPNVKTRAYHCPIYLNGCCSCFKFALLQVHYHFNHKFDWSTHFAPPSYFRCAIFTNFLLPNIVHRGSSSGILGVYYHKLCFLSSIHYQSVFHSYLFYLWMSIKCRFISC